MQRLNQIVNAKHLYIVEVVSDGGRMNILVDANNRAQARKVAEKNGYQVCSMSLEG